MKRNKMSDFFLKEHKKLVSYVSRWINDISDLDPEDIVQDVIVNIINRADISIPIENLSAYVYRSLKNKIIDFFRKKKDIVSLDSRVSADSDLSFSDLLPDTGIDILSDLEKNEQFNALYKAIDALDAQDQAIIIATEMEGCSFRQLSEEWGVPIGTLLSRKSRALMKMKKIMNGFNVNN